MEVIMMKFNQDLFSKFAVGDKVSLVKLNLKGNAKAVGKGTVTKITNKTITVRQYRKKTLGWNIRLEGEILLAQGWDNSDEDLNRLVFHNRIKREIGEYKFIGCLDTGKLESYKGDILADECWIGTMKNEDEFNKRSERMHTVLTELEEEKQRRKQTA
jgi:hypothetical protein